MPSIKDVARKAGVSVTTVSLVLNNKGHISQKTRERVLEAVQELDYTRSIQARNLREQQSRIIGYAQFKNRGEFNPLLDRFLYELVQLVEGTGWHLLMFNTDDQDIVTPYRELIDSRRVDGFVLSYTQQGDERFRYLNDAHVPFVAFGKSATELDDITHWVDVDGEAGIYMATEHLIDLGHIRIAFIGWPDGSVSGDLRYSGYVKSLQDYNIPIYPDYIIRTENYTANGYACGAQLMALVTPPTALVAISDVLAIGAIQYFLEIGQCVAVTGFDDIPTAAYMYPALTSVRQPITQVADTLMEMLLQQLDGVPVEKRQHVVTPELIIRASSVVNY